MKILHRLSLLLLAALLLCGLAACSKGEENDPPATTAFSPSHDPRPQEHNGIDYEKITVTLTKTTYSLSEDTKITANILADYEFTYPSCFMFYDYPNIEKLEDGEWVRYENTDTRNITCEESVIISYDKEGNPICGYSGDGWITYYVNNAYTDITIADIAPQMTPGHYRMIVYLANSYTYYLEFDLVA